MKFRFQGSDPELEYKIQSVQATKTEYGWRKVEFLLSDVKGVQAAGSVRMTMAEMDIVKVYKQLDKPHGRDFALDLAAMLQNVLVKIDFTNGCCSPIAMVGAAIDIEDLIAANLILMEYQASGQWKK